MSGRVCLQNVDRLEDGRIERGLGMEVYRNGGGEKGKSIRVFRLTYTGTAVVNQILVFFALQRSMSVVHKTPTRPFSDAFLQA